MNALLAESPPAAPAQGPDTQPPPPGTAPAPGAEAPPQAQGAACAHCGKAMAAGQDWCLHCGAAAPSSVGGSGWRPAAGILAVTVALVLGAAAAGVAALSRKGPRAPVVTTTVAQVPTPAAPAPAVSTPSTPVTGIAQPPKIPLKAITPPPAATTPAASTPSTTKTETAKEEEAPKTKTGGAGGEPEPEAILLDTNAAHTYNPYAYPAAGFGDPSLAIDGDSSTGWTAQVNPATAPRLAEGILIDLKTAQKVGFVKIVTSTPGIVIQIYGANGHNVPGSITDKGWVPLSKSLTIRKRHTRIVLRHQKKSYRFVTVWISRAPASAVGTAEAPGSVAIDEVELFPAK